MRIIPDQLKVFFRSWDRLAETGSCTEDADALYARSIPDQLKFFFRSWIASRKRGLALGGADALDARSIPDQLKVFFRCWDRLEETGSCTGDADALDARRIADHLKIEFREVDFVKEYWNFVFSYMMESYSAGLTPNPDVLCNSMVKFGSFMDYATDRLHGDAIATGHYAQNSYGNLLERKAGDLGTPARLLKATDPMKDQTLFLCRMPQTALQRTMFPIGNLTKTEVKEIGTAVGLSWVTQKRSSRGICFVGKREFDRFIDSFLDIKKGRFVHAETGEVLGEHLGYHHYTLGQRARIIHRATALFVVKKDVATNDVYVAEGTHHPMLYADSFTCSDHHFIASHDQRRDAGSFPWAENPWQGSFRFQHQMSLIGCTNERIGRDLTSVKLERIRRALTPGQFAVFYDGDVVLGSAIIKDIGPSVYDRKQSVVLDPDTVGLPGWEAQATATAV